MSILLYRSSYRQKVEKYQSYQIFFEPEKWHENADSSVDLGAECAGCSGNHELEIFPFLQFRKQKSLPFWRHWPC